jgi:hypothetical protein
MLVLLNPAQPTDPSGYSNLPKLAVNTEFGTFGFEGYLAYDVGELNNGNPWTENNSLTIMPVFTNPGKYDGAGIPLNGLSPEEMMAEAEKLADLFGLQIISLETEPTQAQIEQILQKLKDADASEEEIRQNTSTYKATAECKGARIEVNKDGHIVLTLTPETADLAKEIGKLSAYDSFTIDFDFGYETIDGIRYSFGLPLLKDTASPTAILAMNRLRPSHNISFRSTAPLCVSKSWLWPDSRLHIQRCPYVSEHLCL